MACAAFFNLFKLNTASIHRNETSFLLHAFCDATFYSLSVYLIGFIQPGQLVGDAKTCSIQWTKKDRGDESC